MNTKTILSVICLITSFAVHAVDEKFFNALHQVEASGRTGKVIGDSGKALGPLQIHKAYFLDAAAFDKSLGKDYSKVQDLAFAKRVVRAYLKRYAPNAVKRNDYQTLARIHNGGPIGHKNEATVKYWAKVKRHI